MYECVCVCVSSLGHLAKSSKVVELVYLLKPSYLNQS